MPTQTPNIQGLSYYLNLSIKMYVQCLGVEDASIHIVYSMNIHKFSKFHGKCKIDLVTMLSTQEYTFKKKLGISYAKISNISPSLTKEYSLKNKVKCITQFQQNHKHA